MHSQPRPVHCPTTMKTVGGGDHPHPYPATVPKKPFHLLEITVISAQGLYPAARSIHTYASAWVDAEHKLRTRVDGAGRSDPTWNDKLVFRVDDAFLRSDTAAVEIHLHAARSRLSPLPDHLLGVVRVVLSTLHPAPGARRCVALQVRRPCSLRPHGVLNLGVALLDPSVPLYHDHDSPAAFAYKDLESSDGRRRRSPDDVCGKWQQLQRNGSVEVEQVAEQREREELETKLEMWKAEMTPDHRREDETNSSKKLRRRSSRWLSFFSCGGKMYE